MKWACWKYRRLSYGVSLVEIKETCNITVAPVSYYFERGSLFQAFTSTSWHNRSRMIFTVFIYFSERAARGRPFFCFCFQRKIWAHLDLLLSIPHRGENVKTLSSRWDHRYHRLQRDKTSPVVVTLGQQYNVGEKPTVIILYTYINRHAGTPKKTTTNKNNLVHTITKTNQNQCNST